MNEKSLVMEKRIGAGNGTFDYEIELRPTKSEPITGVGAEGIKRPEHNEQWEKGRSFARSAKIIKEQDEHKEALTLWAKTGAGETHITDTDPNNYGDRTLLNKLDRLESTEYPEIDAKIKYAESHRIDAEEEMQKNPAVPQKSEEPLLQIGVFAFALAIPLLPTIAEYNRWGDPVLNWSSAVIISLLIGLFVALVSFYTPSNNFVEDSKMSWAGFALGAFIALGFCMVRIHFGGDVWIALGLTVVELGIILAVEMTARRYRSSVQAWETQYNDNLKKTSALNNKIERVRELKDLRNQIEDNIEEIRRELNHRFVQAHVPLDVKENAFAAAALAGYSCGVAENRAEHDGKINR